MARIPEHEIERLKREVSLVRLAEARSVSLVKSGDNLLGLCPFHDDREPSLVITPEKNLWHCLGACQAGGSVIDWVMRAEGISFRHAVELLRRDAVPAGSTKGPPPKLSVKRKLEPIARADAEGGELLDRVVNHYHATLRESAEGAAYLASRGLSHPEVVEHFRLGLANRTLGYQLPHSYVKDGAALRSRLTELGVYRASGHEHLSGCLVVPLFDAAGQVVGLYGRRIERTAPHPKHLYLPGPHRGVFNRQGLGGEEAIVCEALIDALTFWCAGMRNVTSAYGVEGVTDELIETIAAAGTKRVQIAFDRDEAGDKGAEKLSVRLAAVGIETFRVLFPRNMDANAYARKVSPADKALELAVRQAVWMRAAKGSKTSPAASPPAPETTSPEGSAGATSAEIPSLAASCAHLESSIQRPTSLAAPLPAPAPAAPTPAAPAPAAPAPAAPAPAAPAPAAPSKLEIHGEERLLRFEARKWRVRPAGKSGAGELRVNVMVTAEGEDRRFFVDTLDLYAARQRAVFLKHAAAELQIEERVLSGELGLLVLELELERDRAAASSETKNAGPTMTEEEREEALSLLRDPRLADRLLEDLERAGIVGEETNKLVGYLAATSRKLDEPLAVVIQSSSAAGKSSLMDAVLALIPEEDRVQYSAMTGQSLFYMGGHDLKHKVLAIVEEEGAERASYALKLLQSEGELTIASTGKDPATGRLVTQTYRVEGPVMIFLTTTAIEVDEELLNRCIVLSVDEGREQTRAIHGRQRRARTLVGQMEAVGRRRIRRLYRNAQRLLRPVAVVNPFAEELRFPDHTTRTRRDHMKYLTLISAVALLYQHQRPLRRVEDRGQVLEYIEATKQDVAVATRLAHAVLGRSLDELPPQTRRLLHEIEAMVLERVAQEGLEQHQVRFSRREVRERTSWGNTQLKVHMGRLEELEYLFAHRMRGALVQYELRYGGEGKDGGRFVIGLDYDDPRSGSNGDRSGQTEDRSALGRGPVGPRSAGGRVAVSREWVEKKAANGASPVMPTEIASREPSSKPS
jgi:DNA primase catalytic core